MKLLCSTFISLILFGSCASIPYNSSKPEMSVPDNGSYRMPPRIYNQNRSNWENQ